MSVLSRLCGREGFQVQSRVDLHDQTLSVSRITCAEPCTFGILVAVLASLLEHSLRACSAHSRYLNYFRKKAGIDHRCLSNN